MSDHNKSYLEQRREMKLKGKRSAAEQKQEDRNRADFFKQQISQAPACCENCKKSLRASMAINPASIIAHIVPKRTNYGCPSVETHPLNRWYGCIDCHTKYDTNFEDPKVICKMPVYKTVVQRLKQFIDQIAPAELKNVPEYLIIAVQNE